MIDSLKSYVCFMQVFNLGSAQGDLPTDIDPVFKV